MSFIRNGPRYPYQSGGMIYYEGSRRQRGGNLFSALKRMIMPSATSALKKVGKEAMKRGVALSAGAIKDKLLNKDVTIQDAFRDRAAQALEKAAADVDTLLSSQDGAGLRQRRKRKASRAHSATPRKRRKAAAGKQRRKGKVQRRPLKRLQRKSINKVKAPRRGNSGRSRQRKTTLDIFG